MKLVIVVDRYIPEARSAAHLYEDLAKGLARRGHDVRVLTKHPVENLPHAVAAPPRKEVRDGVRIERLSSPMGEPRSTWLKGTDQALFAVRVLLHLILHERPDVVLVYTPPLLLAGACAAADLLFGIRMVVNLHDLYPRTAIELGRLRSPLLIGLARRLERFVYRRARMLVVPAPESVEYLVQQAGIPAARVRLVYNWVAIDADDAGDGASFRAETGLEGRFVVSYAGVIGLAQDLSTIIDAARQATGDEELVFLIIGEGPRLEHWKAEGAGLPNLRFLPTLPRERYLDALRASDIGLLALSRQLGSPAIPGKLQSIMSVKRPVLAVVPENSAAARAVRDAACGYVIPPGDGKALLRAIAEMRADARLRERLAIAGQQYAKDHFALESAVSLFEAALNSALVDDGPQQDVLPA